MIEHCLRLPIIKPEGAISVDVSRLELGRTEYDYTGSVVI